MHPQYLVVWAIPTACLSLLESNAQRPFTIEINIVLLPSACPPWALSMSPYQKWSHDWSVASALDYHSPWWAHPNNSFVPVLDRLDHTRGRSSMILNSRINLFWLITISLLPRSLLWISCSVLGAFWLWVNGFLRLISHVCTALLSLPSSW